ncbi:hypothetical protein F5884DRAFT_518715 [Xylogone sp. PMI_703]|nr:hypothetical protein F5884DRAFT_518715 [Xylogone sp. PMI_703]
MPLFEGDFWIGAELFSMPFSDMQGAVIGVEATSYLQHMIDEPPAHEPLLAALGGSPIGLKEHIRNELDQWKSNGMKPIFVFDGQSIMGKEDMALRNAKSALLKTQTAWDLYADNHPEDAVKAFGASG